MSFKKLIKSFKYAWEGIKSSIKSEQNMKVHILIMELVVLLGLVLNINYYEWLIILVCFMVVISGELFNTAIENVVNLLSPNKNEIAKLSKDIAAGAVLVGAFFSAIIGLMIFLPKIFYLLKGLML